MRKWIGQLGSRARLATRRAARKYRWPGLFLLLGLYVVLFVPIVPFRVPCSDGGFRTVSGQVVYPYGEALLRELALLNVDYSVHFGPDHQLQPTSGFDRWIRRLVNWQSGTIRIRLLDWLDDNDVRLASSRAILSLLFEDYGADLDAIPDHVNAILEAGVKGPYLHSDCELVRAVAIDWHGKP